MISKLMNGRNRKPMFQMPDLSRMEKQEIERIYARLFSTDDGRQVLAHLQAMAFMRAYSAESSDEQIRYAEGQRALVANIMRLINAGRQN